MILLADSPRHLSYRRIWPLGMIAPPRLEHCRRVPWQLPRSSFAPDLLPHISDLVCVRLQHLPDAEIIPCPLQIPGNRSEDISGGCDWTANNFTRFSILYQTEVTSAWQSTIVSFQSAHILILVLQLFSHPFDNSVVWHKWSVQRRTTTMSSQLAITRLRLLIIGHCGSTTFAGFPSWFIHQKTRNPVVFVSSASEFTFMLSTFRETCIPQFTIAINRWMRTFPLCGLIALNTVCRM